MSQLIIDRAESLYAKGRDVYGFHNWLGMQNYETACRVELTEWVFRHRSQSIFHIGVASRMVAMGVAVANLALGNLLHVHNSVSGLESALARILNRA
jgi:hypothetical protein